MKRLTVVVVLIAANMSAAFAQKKGVVVAFYDEERLRNPVGQEDLKSFLYFFKEIQTIVKRDFPTVELRILRRGELASLRDGTRVNVQTMTPQLGYVLSAPGKKRRVLTGAQSDADFACAAAAYFKRRSPACPKSMFE
jgi:hypothetical protein